MTRFPGVVDLRISIFILTKILTRRRLEDSQLVSCENNRFSAEIFGMYIHSQQIYFYLYLGTACNSIVGGGADRLISIALESIGLPSPDMKS